MHKSIVLGILAALAAAAVAAIPAGAKPRGMNGQITFNRFEEPDTAIFTVNPDGTHEQRLVTHPPLTTPNECPNWSPDGNLIATCGNPDNGASVIINRDTGSWRELADADPTLGTACSVWSPDGKRLACELAYDPADPRRDGIYTIRASDGGDLTRMTSNPGGHDQPGDYSPNGKRLVFIRSDPNGDTLGMFVVKVDGKGLKQIVPGSLTPGAPSGAGDWSPQGNEIVFSRRVTADVHGSLWVVHPNGHGLREIKVKGLACGGANDDPNAMGCFDPHWSPDGKKIVFGVFLAGSRNLYTINADGSGLTQVSHGDDDYGPNWARIRRLADRGTLWSFNGAPTI